MKLKDIIQITVFTVIAFVLGMAVSMGTGMLGTASLYIASGFSALVIAPPFFVMAKKAKKKPAAFIFFMFFYVAGCFLVTNGILADAYNKFNSRHYG